MSISVNFKSKVRFVVIIDKHNGSNSLGTLFFFITSVVLLPNATSIMSLA